MKYTIHSHSHIFSIILFQGGGEDVVMFAPPTQAQDVTANQNEEMNSDPPITDNGEMHSTNQMTVSEIVRDVDGMIDSVHDFGAAEMAIENNEEFVPASEGNQCRE